MSAETKKETPRRAGLREQVLLAALDCSGGDLDKTFTSEDLLVAAWKRDRFAFGLRDTSRSFPTTTRYERNSTSRGCPTRERFLQV